MFGLFIALIIAAVAGAQQQPGHVIYRRAANFLVTWYIVFGVIAVIGWGLIAAIGSLIVSLLFGPVASLVAAGVSTVWIIVTVGFLAACQIIGAMCLRNALVENASASSGYQFRGGVAALGTILLFIGIWNFSS